MYGTGQIIVEVQELVAAVGKGFRNPLEESAVQSAGGQCEGAYHSPENGVSAAALMKGKIDSGTVYPVGSVGQGVPEAVQKTTHHMIVFKMDGGIDDQVGRVCKNSHLENGKPPVSSFHTGILVQPQGDIQHVIAIHAVKRNSGVVQGRYNTVRIVDPQFTAGIDAVLSLPEFNEPGAVIVVKIDGFVIIDHVKVRCSQIIEMHIAEFFLGSTLSGGKNILFRVVEIAQGLEQGIYELLFFVRRHALNFSDRRFFLKMQFEYEKEDQRQKRQYHDQGNHTYKVEWFVHGVRSFGYLVYLMRNFAVVYRKKYRRQASGSGF